MITVRGTGFAPSGNRVRIGSAVANDLHFPDGKTITFRAPDPEGKHSFPACERIRHWSFVPMERVTRFGFGTDERSLDAYLTIGIVASATGSPISDLRSARSVK
jgi:hypothetical protein